MNHEQAVEKHAAERYLLDEMPELERFAFEEHLFGCQICAEDVRTGAVMQEAVKEGLLPKASGSGLQASGSRLQASGQGSGVRGQGSEEPRTPNLANRENRENPANREHRSVSRFVPWAMAAGLAVAVGYQSLWVVPGLRDQVIGPSVLSPVVLRGATRGAEPTLTRPARGAISLAVDLAGVAAGSRLTYDLRAADGTSVASGTAAAPPPGTPLLLLIPASALDSAGGYVLSVGTGDPGPAAVDYRFTMTNP